MKSFRFSILTSIVLLAIVMACSSLFPGAAPDRSIEPVKVVPSNTAIPTEVPATATLVPIQLAGPPMEVGSLWPYVDGSILVAVPGGPFTMGHGGSDNPEHTVTLSDFWIYQAKVTNQQYALCVQAGKCKTPDPIDDFTFNDLSHANDPAVGITYAQASDYCTFVHGQLPTEAQWEKTARGPDGYLYPWGDNAPVCDLLNYNNCVGKITDTTSYPDGQSYYRALDLEGNVFEWVADWYNPLYYVQGPTQDPLGPDSGQQRSVRAASYKSKPEQIPASTRFFTSPKDHRRDLGFRCVVFDPTYFAPLCSTLGSAQAGSPKCPDVGIGLTASCQQGKVTVVVTNNLSPDPNASVSGLAGCTPVSASPGTFPQIYDCFSDTTASIISLCSYSGASSPTCSSHYELNSETGTCDWDGSDSLGKECLPGYTYDPLRQCCAAPQTVGSICSLGSALGLVSGNPACVPSLGAQNVQQAVEYVHIKDPASCVGGKPNAGGSETSPDPCPGGGTYVCIVTAYPPFCYCR